ncbi:MAG: ISNCY family transposase [Kiritimatiellaeota bacterium]|nr:ISNCY family transposase [Kiritimatiellota bacterium]
MVACTRRRMAALHDRRTGRNTQYPMADIGLSAFSVFYTQSPSFLAFQTTMQQNKGLSNAQTLFGIEKIPTDNHIRHTLDEVPPEELYPLYDEVYEALREQGIVVTFRGVGNTTPIALDGTWYFDSAETHCENCSRIEHKTGLITYYHSAITPVIVAPGQRHAIALRPEFITPQDGHNKQDCEIAAAKRWLDKEAAHYLPGLDHNATLLGDDLYAHQPFCRRVLLQRYHFIFTCKPDSHTYLYTWVNQLEAGQDIRTVTMRVKDAKGHWEDHTYRYANGVPLVEGEGALKVNWCEVTITGKARKKPYHNAFITDWKIDDDNVAGIVATGRARWKIENENNNTLKTKGYHLEHNFGHGKQHLSSLLAAMNMLALLMHTFLAFGDDAYQLIRATLPTRKTFFDDIRALTRYICFPSWAAMMDFMMRGLEIGPYASAPDPA